MSQGDLSIDSETGRAVRAGLPYVPRDSLSGRLRGLDAGTTVDLVDGRGFAGRGIFDPAAPFAVRVLTLDRRQSIDGAFWRAGIERAAALRRGLPGLSVTDAFRVVNAEGDRLPGLVIESYSSYAVLRLQSESLRPHLGAIVDAVRHCLQPRGIYEKRSSPEGGRGHHLGGSTAPDSLPVREGNLRFNVRLAEGAKTGLVLDQRDARRTLARLARGRQAACCFSWTGASSLTLAAAGAARVVSIDPVPGSIAAGRENFAANGLPPESHEFLVGDPRDVLARIAASARRFDLLLVDTPWFDAKPEPRPSKSGKSSTPSRKRPDPKKRAGGKKRRMAPAGGAGGDPLERFRAGYAATLAQAYRVLNPSGLLLLTVDRRRFGEAQFLGMLRSTADAAGMQVQVVESHGRPPDFPLDPAWPAAEGHGFLVCAVRPLGAAPQRPVR